MWTIESVKAELPKVKIKIGNKIVDGNISGRRNKFATVWTKDNMQGWEFAWATIAKALNGDRPLKV